MNANQTPRPRRFTARRAALAGALLGLIALCYVAGAAAIYFRLPSSAFLSRAFAGGRDWMDPAPSAAVNGDLSRAGLTTYQPADACAGYTLYTTTRGPDATLLDMQGNAVHRWRLPRSPAWPRATEVSPNKPLHFERVYLYPNGDLLALCGIGGDVPYGCGVVKLDKDSHFLWGYEANVHHDLDVGDDSRIYVLTQRTVPTLPPGAPPSSRTIEQILILSAEGRHLATISLSDAFANSPYALTVPDAAKPSVRGTAPPGDQLHSNSVKVLSAALAPKFPLFKAGHILLSLRTPNVLAVVDPATGSVVWAAKGIWQAQHDAEFLDNGRLLLFDNMGGGRGARVLEYDPNTQAVPWSWEGVEGTRFGAAFRGTSQRLSNGGTLVVDPGGCRIVEVGRGQEVVWEWGLPPATPGTLDPNVTLNVTGARRFSADELPFLKGP